jgi:hypothetical protein
MDQEDPPDDQGARRSLSPLRIGLHLFSPQRRPGPVEIDCDREDQGRRPEVEGASSSGSLPPTLLAMSQVMNH